MAIKARVLVKSFVLAAVASLAVTASASAETLSSTPTSSAEPAPAVQAENQPQRLQLCDRENPAIDYRACVNASTRDLSKKIRQA